MMGDGNSRGGEPAVRVDEAGGTPRGDAREPVIDTVELMRGRRAIGIRHHGELYRLSITSKDKLILTK